MLVDRVGSWYSERSHFHCVFVLACSFSFVRLSVLVPREMGWGFDHLKNNLSSLFPAFKCQFACRHISYATICTDCSAKSYYAAAKANDPARKIMQIPLFLGAIAIFYVSGEIWCAPFAFAYARLTAPIHTPEQRQRKGLEA